jgi:uncharacterized protein (DUF2236 family)
LAIGEWTLISTRVNAERLVLLGWSRAILLQLAHPLVAAGVDEHSTFRAGKLASALRLHQTVRAMLSLTFGTDTERQATLDRINGIHRRVNGRLRDAAGPFPAGTQYSAEDPRLLLWVHATLLESIPLVYDMVVAPLSATERDDYCREAESVVVALGAQVGAPRSWRDLAIYMDRMHASGEIVVSRQARELADAVLAPPLAWALGPTARINWLFTVGLLPPSIRDQYRFKWTDRDARALERWSRVIRRGRKLLPNRIAWWGEAS